MPALLPRGCLAWELRAQLVEPAARVLNPALPLTSCQQLTVPPSTVHSNFLFSWSPSSEGDDSATAVPTPTLGMRLSASQQTFIQGWVFSVMVAKSPGEKVQIGV